MVSRSRRSAAVILLSTIVVLLSACTSVDGEPRSAATTSPVASSTSPGPSTTTPPEDEQPLADPSRWGVDPRDWRQALAAARTMSVPELAGGVIVASYGGSRAPVRLVRSLDLAGVIVGTTNVSSTTAQQATNRRLQRSVRRPGGWPLVIAVDQEGGQVSRLGPPVTPLPSYMSLGAAARPGLARQAAMVTGAELREAGFTMVMAPVADVTIGAQDTAIGSRSAGSDPAAVSRLVASSVQGFERAGIVPVVKHFPGHGSVGVDSHVGLPRQRHSIGWLTRRDFVPFQRAVDAHAPAVMVGHIALSHVDRGVPADLSADSIDVLRSRLGFEGLIVSDSLQMSAVTNGYRGGQAAVAALDAGVDVVLMPVDPQAARDAIVRAVRNGTLSRERLEVSVARIGAAMLHQKRSAELPARVVERGAALAQRISAAAITVVSGKCRGPYVAAAVKPVGPKWLVQSFTAVARASGLRVGSGPRLLLVDSDTRLKPASIAVSVDVPYRLAELSEVPVRFALYGSSPAALGTLVDVLQGDRRAVGRLPVDLDTARRACA